MDSRKRSREGDFPGELYPSNQTSTKRLQTYTKSDALLATIFDRLGSELEDERIDAGAEVIKQFSLLEDSREKILLRLLRGLCSSRKASRLGFFVALTEILKVLANDSRLLNKSSRDEAVQFIVHFAKAETEVGSAPTTQEKRDYLIGRLSALTAIIHSEILFDHDLNSKHMKDLLEHAWEIGSQDQQLIEQCGKLYCDIIQIAGQKNNREDVVGEVLECFARHSALRTPEGVAIWIEATATDLPVRFPKNVWHHKNPLSRKEIPSLGKILSGSVADNPQHLKEPSGKPAIGKRRDNPHFVWDIILRHFYNDEHSRLKAQDNHTANHDGFQKFWTKCVDESFFAASASSERKAQGFRILTMVLGEGPTWACQLALSSNLISCLMNQEKNSKRYLHQAAISLVETLKVRSRDDVQLASAIASILTYKKGIPSAEYIKQGGNVLCDLFDIANAPVARVIVEQHLTALENLIMEDNFDEEKLKTKQASIKALTDTILNFCRKRKTEEVEQLPLDLSWRSLLLSGLAKLACLKWDLGDDVLTTSTISAIEQTRHGLESKLWSCLKEILASQLIDAASTMHELCKQLDQLARESLYYLFENDEAWMATRRASDFLTVIDQEEKAGNSSGLDVGVTRAFKLMLSTALLLVYIGDKDAIGLIEELKDHHKSLNVDSNHHSQNLNEIVEIVLSFTSRTEAVYRNIAEQVFLTFTDHITFDGLQPLIRILEQEENTSGQKELFEDMPDDESEHTEREITINRPSKVSEQNNGQEKNFGESGELDNSSDSASLPEGSEESEDNEEVAADEALNQSLAEILQVQSFGNGMNGTGEEEDKSSSDESMDDAQMEALGIDEKLAQIFSQQKSHDKSSGKGSGKKQDQKDAKRNMLTFKNRGLDLLSIYLKRRYSSSDALRIILPILRLIEITRSPQISRKSADLLDSYFKTAKSKGMPLETPDVEVWTLIKEVHEDALRFPSKIHASTSTLEKIIMQYAESHIQRIQKSSQLPASFWTDFVNWTVSLN